MDFAYVSVLTITVISISPPRLSGDGLCEPHLRSVFTYFPTFGSPVFEMAPMQTCCEVQSLETSNVNNENQTQTIYFLGERTHFCWKWETTAEKIVPSSKRGTAEIYCYREKEPAVIPGLHNNIPKKVERTGRRRNSTSERSIWVCV